MSAGAAALARRPSVSNLWPTSPRGGRVGAEDAIGAARSGDRAGRPRLPRRATTRSRPTSSREALAAVDPAQGARPAHGAVGARAAGAPGPLRDAASPASSTSRSPVRRARASRAGRRRQDRASARSTPTSSSSPATSSTSRRTSRLIAAQAADRRGQPLHRPQHRGHAGHRRGHRLHATASSIAQVNESRRRPCRASTFRPTGSTSWSSRRGPIYIEPLFTRDPAQITEIQVLMAMMAIKGIYAEYGVQRLNHGIGFDTAAIELLLPTYGEELGLKGKICTHWALNPHPTLIPAIEAGFVESVHCFGSEVGMEALHRARPDVFFTGADGSMRSNRAFCQTAGHYACDLFIGSTLQIDLARQQLDRHARAHRRLRRRAEHGSGRARPAPREPGLAEGRRGGAPGATRPCRAGRSSSCRWSRPSASTCSPPSSSGSTPGSWRTTMSMATAAGDDLRRRRHAHRHRGRHRQPAAVPRRRRARAGDPRRRRLHAGRPRARPAHGREPARARRHPPRGGSRHRPAHGHARPAGRALDQGPGAGLGRPLQPPSRFRNW